PADISLRVNLIELLEHQERWNEVLDQYVDLASTYRHLADFSSARSTYDQAVKLAQRTGAPATKMVEILHKLGEVDMERIELRGAMRTYQRILEIAPDNVKARRHLAELHYRLNNPVQGIQEIDLLLQNYAKQKRPDLILEVLEEQTQSYPNDMALRSRLGGVYQQMRQNEKAFEQFEALRRLQSEAGLHDEARQTIRRIISLNPPQVSHYQQLLQQMGG
ncbi:MAG TPA: tetratricopeptide repeat protein, partial [Aggregatilineales bacterium]|nr:tetratricopeptide repeat protein [Aggregatilineales bacterium]